MLVVAALGGNALLRRSEPLEAELQQRNVKIAAAALAEVAAEHHIVVTHGNGPQIGLLALQSEAYRDVQAYPLDVLGAESEGMIGYLLEQELGNALPGRDVVSLITQVVVDAHDPAFRNPTKPIGPVYSITEARRLATERGWTVAPEAKNQWRRVVASPAPCAIPELRAIRLLLDHGIIVVCAGGGGIPVINGPDGAHHGVEAVVDKDLAAALLARQLGADALLLLTDVSAVELDWGTAAARPLRFTTPTELSTYRFAAGSMQPKVNAAASFVASTGGIAGIGALSDARAILAGDAGTIVNADALREGEQP